MTPLVIVAFVTGTIPAQAGALDSWRFDSATNQLEVTLQDGTTPRYFLLTQPQRIVLDLPNTQLGKVATQQNYSGAVRQVRVSQFQEGVTRIVLELSKEVVLAPQQVQLQKAKSQNGQGDRWLLRPLIVGQSASVPMPKRSPLINTLPSATDDTKQEAVISVPPPVNPVTPSTGKLPSAILPPATFDTRQPVVVSVPRLRSQGAMLRSSAQRKPDLGQSAAPENSPISRVSTLSNPETTARFLEPYKAPVIEFGQPLPKVEVFPN